MRIAVCDDEQKFIDDFKRITDKLYPSLDMVVDTFSDGTELLKSFGFRAYDLVFLDIEMPEMDGITLAEKLRETSDEVSIVFLTGHIEYAVKGYEVNALRYLTKPADEQKVKDVIDRVLKKLGDVKMLWIKTDEGEVKLRLSDILFIESQNQNVLISTAEDSYSVRGNMNDYEKRLEQEGFFRIHRGYIVSLARVSRLSGKEVVMEDGTTLPVSRSKEARLKEVLFSFISREAF
ncbi:MAG: response regulator transcription factor [Ruminococcus sp.]|nr:response regulator transcription factor [Ruminococcus sp.]MBP3271012.1 response regulator transcription factor [Ruminococcus sp.]